MLGDHVFIDVAGNSYNVQLISPIIVKWEGEVTTIFPNECNIEIRDKGIKESDTK